MLDNFLLNLPLPLLDHWGYLIVFISAIIEALPILGTFFPGHTVVILGGFFANLGILRLDGVIIVAAAGAIAGDLIGYIVGRRYGQDFIIRYGKYFFIHQDKFNKTKQLVQENAGKTIVIGRFSPLTRAFTPLAAGIFRVKIVNFFFYDILGGLLWAASSVFLGYIFGQGFSAASKYFGRLVILAVIAIILIIMGYRWLDKRRHIFAKYHVYYLALLVLSIYGFFKMIEDYFQQESIYRLDLWLEQNIYFLWSQWLSRLMNFITNIFSPEVLLVISLAGAVYFFLKKKLYKAGLIFLASGGGAILGQVLKYLIKRPRPEGGLVEETGFSFPSNHSLIAMIFFVLVLSVFTKKIRRQWLRILFICCNLLLILAVGFSRIYLRVHYLSDVLAGYALGLLWFASLILIFRISGQLMKDKIKK